MKNIIKIMLLSAIVLGAANQSEAQAGHKLTKADAAKLPSNRPMPDMAAMQQKIAKMRADAKKQELLQQQINNGRRNQDDRQLKDTRQPVSTPVKQ